MERVPTVRRKGHSGVREERDSVTGGSAVPVLGGSEDGLPEAEEADTGWRHWNVSWAPRGPGAGCAVLAPSTIAAASSSSLAGGRLLEMRLTFFSADYI